MVFSNDKEAGPPSQSYQRVDTLCAVIVISAMMDDVAEWHALSLTPRVPAQPRRDPASPLPLFVVDQPTQREETQSYTLLLETSTTSYEQLGREIYVVLAMCIAQPCKDVCTIKEKQRASCENSVPVDATASNHHLPLPPPPAVPANTPCVDCVTPLSPCRPAHSGGSRHLLRPEKAGLSSLWRFPSRAPVTLQCTRDVECVRCDVECVARFQPYLCSTEASHASTCIHRVVALATSS